MSTTKLDANQVLKGAYDEPNKRLRVDAAISGDIIIDDLNISQTDDSIRIGDGTNLITATVDGGKTGLDVNVINDIEISIDAASDSIAIGDGVDTLAVEPDGSININVLGTTEVTATDLDIRNLAASQDNIAISDGTDTLAINNDGSVNITDNGSSLTVDAVDFDIRDLSHVTDSVSIGNGTNIAEVNSNLELLVKDTDLASKLDAGVILSGTDDGTTTGVKYPLVYNLRQQILAAEDREQDITYADFGTRNQRIIQIDYSSAKIGSTIARKNIEYTLIGNKYRRDSINWILI